MVTKVLWDSEEMRLAMCTREGQGKLALIKTILWKKGKVRLIARKKWRSCLGRTTTGWIAMKARSMKMKKMAVGKELEPGAEEEGNGEKERAVEQGGKEAEEAGDEDTGGMIIVIRREVEEDSDRRAFPRAGARERRNRGEENPRGRRRTRERTTKIRARKVMQRWRARRNH